MEPTTKKVLLVYVSLVLDKTLCYFEPLYLVLGSVVPLVLYGQVWYIVDFHIPNFVLSEYLCMRRLSNLRLSNYLGRYIYNYYF